MVIVLPNGTVNRISRNQKTPVKPAFSRFRIRDIRNAFTFDSSQYLNYPSNFIGHHHPDKPDNGA